MPASVQHPEDVVNVREDITNLFVTIIAQWGIVQITNNVRILKIPGIVEITNNGRILRVPLHLLHGQSKGTFANS